MRWLLDLWRRYAIRSGQRIHLGMRTYRNEHVGIVTICHSEYRWRKVRKAHLKRDPRCNMCKRTKKLEAHHIKPWHLFPDLRFIDWNLITLCRACHFRFGHGSNWKHWNPQVKELCQATKPFMSNIHNEESLV